MARFTLAILALIAPNALADPPEVPAAPEPPTVGLRPITERPEPVDETIAAASPALPNARTGATLTPGSLAFWSPETRAQPLRSSILLQSIDRQDGDLLSALSRRARAGYAYDPELEPLFSDRSNIDLSTNQPGDHSDSHFLLTNVEIGRGVYFRADGVGRAFNEHRRYTTLSAEAYFSLGANAGMSLGFDLVRTGLPGTEGVSMLDEGLFARFIIGF